VLPYDGTVFCAEDPRLMVFGERYPFSQRELRGLSDPLCESLRFVLIVLGVVLCGVRLFRLFVLRNGDKLLCSRNCSRNRCRDRCVYYRVDFGGRELTLGLLLLDPLGSLGGVPFSADPLVQLSEGLLILFPL
jgi:hypothetical protein